MNVNAAGEVTAAPIVAAAPDAAAQHSPGRLAWSSLPMFAQLYVAGVIVTGVCCLVAFVPRRYPDTALFVALLITTILTSVWKVNLPISLGSGSTLSMSLAPNLMALLLLGPSHAVIIAVAGAWVQCTYKQKQPYPLYRAVFSAAAEVLTMAASGLTYGWLGGTVGGLDPSSLARPLVGAISAYFLVDTGIIAGAIALSTGRSFPHVWRQDFLWSGAGFMVAGIAGAIAAFIVERGEQWTAILMLAPVHVIYRTYGLFVGRLEDQRQHAAQVQRLHDQTVDALSQAHRAERALAEEKNRLTIALGNMTRLEEMRNQLLEREHTARASAERANRLKDQFLAIVSHELRTPLTAILGWADLLRRETIAKDRQDRALQSIYRSAKQQAQLIDDLLDVARIVSGTLRLERTLVNLHEVVLEALHVAQPAADAKRIGVSIEMDPSIGPYKGDPSRIHQVMSNLLSNAIKFTPDGGAIHVQLRRVDRMVEIVVNDSGCGIPPEFLPTVFEPFCQADASTTRRQSGLGLGLSIVKHLVEAHDGTISVHSDGEDRGAAFVVRLPTTPPSGDSPQTRMRPRMPVASSDAVDEPAGLEGISVLLVDDDAQCRDAIAAQLESRNAVVMTAASSSQALEVLHRSHVDVLLSDIAMPGEDGYSLVQKLRQSAALNPAVPAAALTALARDEDRQLALSMGFQLHLVKPIDERSLVSAVTTLNRLNLP